MALTGSRTFLGFGFGAVQAGLFLYEAYQSGAFNQLVVAEVMPDAVSNLRQAGGVFTVNVAHADRVEPVQVGPVSIENPASAEDRERLITAVAAAEELATAVPSVDFYATPDPGSLHRILAEGLRRKADAGGPRCVIYVAENNNRAAEILAEQVMDAIPEAERDAVYDQVRFVDTVIAKMCGVHVDAPDLAPVVPGSNRAYLVESFNAIQISCVDFAAGPPYARGISVFQEKDDLLPFEEAKLYGHNAVHALAAYTGAICGVECVADLSDRAGMMDLLRSALVDESGTALIAKYGGLDEYFTPVGYADFADDLLSRMVNPHLRDTVKRVGRDPARKLGWDDRLIGTMRLCTAMGVRPRRYAFGAAAALDELDGSGNPELVLPILWQPDNPDPAEEEAMLALVQEGQVQLQRWRAGSFGDPEALFT